MQGVGHVGYHLCKELHAAGAKLTVADVDTLKSRARAARVRRGDRRPLDDDLRGRVRRVRAVRARRRRSTTTRSRTSRRAIVAGAANNQLAEPRHGDDLHARGILYAPDYAINAGGLVNVAQEVKGYDAEGRAREDARRSTTRSARSASAARSSRAPTYKVADIMVEEKLAAVARG